MRIIGASIILFGLWLMLSGVYQPLTISLGVISTLVVIIVTKRMDSVDGDQVELRLRPLQFIKYQAWLMVQIAKANWAVTKIILTPSLPIRQHLFSVPYSQQTDLGQVIFANSITLTPGTISVETEPGQFLVHAVDYSPNDKLELANMDRHVSAIEKLHAT